MSRRVIRDIIMLLLAVSLGTVVNFKVDDFFIGTIYTVAGIMFSIGMSILVTFNLHGIKNDSYIVRIRKGINRVRNIFIGYFSLSTVIFIVERILRKSNLHVLIIEISADFDFNWNISATILTLIFYSIFYFIINFLDVQRLNNDIFDCSKEI